MEDLKIQISLAVHGAMQLRDAKGQHKVERNCSQKYTGLLLR